MFKWVKKKIKQFRCKHQNTERYTDGTGYFLSDNNQRWFEKCADCDKITDRYWIDEFGYKIGKKW